jgi:hypothetical protein
MNSLAPKPTPAAGLAKQPAGPQPQGDDSTGALWLGSSADSGARADEGSMSSLGTPGAPGGGLTAAINTSTPEPSAYTLIFLGLVAIAVLKLRHRSS